MIEQAPALKCHGSPFGEALRLEQQVEMIGHQHPPEDGELKLLALPRASGQSSGKNVLNGKTALDPRCWW
jgi:hypothetical protein